MDWVTERISESEDVAFLSDLLSGRLRRNGRPDLADRAARAASEMRRVSNELRAQRRGAQGRRVL